MPDPLALAAALVLARLSERFSQKRRPLTSIIMWVAAVLIVLQLAPSAACGADIPPATARAWQRTVQREAQASFGLHAPVAVLGAQIQQESAWRPDARSAYAEGMAQFTAGTAADMARWYPELAPVDVYNPRWAIRALVRYDRRLYGAITDTASDCDRWAMTLSAYNGGLGWLTRDRALCARVSGCTPTRWWGQVEHQTQRASWARMENRAYPDRILHTLQPPYLKAGWGRTGVCQ